MNQQSSLAGAFAHELRNALSPARAALELLQRREAANGAIQPALRTMDRSFAVALQTIDRFVEAGRDFDRSFSTGPEATVFAWHLRSGHFWLSNRLIGRNAAWSNAMPPGNVTDMTGDERAILAAWVASLDR